MKEAVFKESLPSFFPKAIQTQKLIKIPKSLPF
jgi:hypothetical protein